MFTNVSRSSGVPALTIVEFSTARISILIACLALVTLTSCDKNTKEPTRPIATETTALWVTSIPAGATVVVDQGVRGVTPVSVAVSPGRHFVSVQGENCISEDSVTAVPDSVVSFYRTLYVLDAIYEVGPLAFNAERAERMASVATYLSPSRDHSGYIVVAQDSYVNKGVQAEVYRIAFDGTGGDRNVTYARLGAGDEADVEGVGMGPDQSIYLMTHAYVGGRRIERMSIEGDPISSWGGPGRGPGQFEEGGAGSMVVSPKGQVYAYDPGNGRVQRFSATGDYVSSWPTFCCKQALACDADGNIYMNAAQYGYGIDRRTEDGAVLGIISNAHSSASSFHADHSAIAAIQSQSIIRYDFEGRVTHRLFNIGFTPLGVAGDRVGRLYVVGYPWMTNLSQVLVFTQASSLTTRGHVQVFRPAL